MGKQYGETIWGNNGETFCQKNHLKPFKTIFGIPPKILENPCIYRHSRLLRGGPRSSPM